MERLTCPHCHNPNEIDTLLHNVRYRCLICDGRFVVVWDGETPRAIASLTDAELRRQQVESGELRI
jgi:pyruvate-formate lyase-activating enzyme